MNISEKIKYGETLISKGDLDDAVKVFREILAEDKLNYTVLNYLGITYSMLKEYDAAAETLQKAIDSNFSKPNAYLNLAIILFQNGKEKESLAYYESAIEKDGANSTAYYNYAVALNELGNYDKAQINYEKAIEQKTDNYQARYNLGLLNLLQGNYENGWNGYELRDKAGTVKRRIMQGERWTGEIIKNKTLYVYPDQGFGDTIQFVRFLPEIQKRVGTLIFECQPSLFSLLKNISGFDEIVEMKKLLEPVKTYDYYLPITSIGKILKINEQSFVWNKSYISANINAESNWSHYFKQITEKKIGITWRSNSNYKEDGKRAIPLENLECLFSISGIEYFSLQMEPTADEIEILRRNEIKDLSEDIKNFKDTAEIIEQLDLIISTDTAVPHLAGAMDKQVWLLLSNQPDWRWQLERSDSFWYPTVELFRQGETGNWKTVIDAILSRLSKMVETNIKDRLIKDIFTLEGMTRFTDFMKEIKKETYPEAPLDFHTQISDRLIVELLQKINLSQNKRILDVGCGQGLALKKFTEYGYNPVGITLNDTDYKICKNQGYETYLMDQSFLQFENEKFDLIWARHVLEHSIFPYYTLHEYNRVLKKNAWLYVEVPAAGFDAVHENNPNHYSVLTKTMWSSLFLRSGFRKINNMVFKLELTQGGKDQYWIFILQKMNN